MTEQAGGLTYQVDEHNLLAGTQREEPAPPEDFGEALRLAALESFGRVRSVMRDGVQGKDDLNLAKIAQGIIKAYTQHRATESARAALAYGIAKGIAENKAELRRYIEVSEPHHPMVRQRPALSGKGNGGTK